MTKRPEESSSDARPQRSRQQRSKPGRRRRTSSSASAQASRQAAASPAPAASRGWFRTRLSVSQLERMCHRLGRSLKAGIPIAQAWSNESRLYHGRQKQSIQQVEADLASGETAADAVAARDCFPPMFTEMVQVGEESGRLDQALLRLANHYRNLIRLRRTLMQSLTWPILQAIAVAVVISLFFLIAARLETTMQFFRAPDVFMLGLSPLGNLALFWAILLVLAAGLLLLVRGVASGLLGQLPAQIALRMPLLGHAVRTLALSRFTWSFGTAVDSGMDAGRAIRLAVRSTQNRYYTVHEESIAETIRQGDEFHVALEETNVFPRHLIEAVQFGELTGDLPESLERLSDDYREQSELSLKRISQVTGFLIFCLAAALTGTAVILMYANYLGTLNEALQAPMAAAERIEDGEKTTNPIIAARDEAVKEFVENNEDFKQIESIYKHLQNINTQDPNEFLDGF